MIGIYTIFCLLTVQVYYVNVPYQEISDSVSARLEPGDRVVLYINAKRETQSMSMLYYLVSYTDGKLDSDDFYAIIDQEVYSDNLFHFTFDTPYAIQQTNDPEAVADFTAFMDGIDRFWLVEYIGEPLNGDRTLLNPYLNAVVDYEIVYEQVFEREDFNYVLYLYEKDRQFVE